MPLALKRMLGVLHYHSLPHPLRQGLSLNLGLTNLAGWPVTSLWHTSLLPHGWDYRYTYTMELGSPTMHLGADVQGK